MSPNAWPLVNLISTAWSHRGDDSIVERMTANTIRRVKAAAEDLGVANRYLYINYAAAAQADAVFAGYGDKNVQRLREVQRAVDPHGIFTSKGL
jgi:FAD/FMN-containing dehydrogenase